MPRGAEARPEGTPRPGPTIEAEPAAPEPPLAAPPAPERRGEPMALVSLVGVAALAVALGWLWTHPQGSAALEQARGQVATLQQRVQTLEGGEAAQAKALAALRARPQAQPVDLQPLQQRLAALEQRVAAQGQTTAGQTQQDASSDRVQDLTRVQAALKSQLAALDQRAETLAQAQAALKADLGDLTKRVEGVAMAQAGVKSDVGNLASGLAGVTQRLSGQGDLGRRVDDLTHREQVDLEQITQKVAALDSQLKGLRQGSQQVASVARQTAQVARLQAASAALQAGRPLGAIPDAPPALARFATEAPPTESALRLSFPAAAEAARAAAQPDGAGKPLLARWWARAQQSFTVRQGDEVLIGNPVNGILSHAQQRLDAGDLAGAVQALAALPAPAAAAMSGWTGQARALLAARAALAQMAAHA